MKAKEGQGAGGKGQGGWRVPEADDTFENLEIWQESIELAARVYELLHDCRDYGFRSQIQEAAASISNNIAECYERDSNQELIRFCIIAKGSCGEVRSLGYLGRRLKLLSAEQASPLIAEAKRLSKRIARYVAVRREKFT
jgi:four helix bundle protein